MNTETPLYETILRCNRCQKCGASLSLMEVATGQPCRVCENREGMKKAWDPKARVNQGTSGRR
jgi:hypothetical protein